MSSFIVAMRSGLRRSRCALSEWFLPLWLLCKRLVIALAWIVIAVVLPIYGLVAEGPGAGAMKASAVGFVSGLWEAAKAGPGLAIAGAVALSVICWRLFQLYVSRSKIPATVAVLVCNRSPGSHSIGGYGQPALVRAVL